MAVPGKWTADVTPRRERTIGFTNFPKIFLYNDFPLQELVGVGKACLKKDFCYRIFKQIMKSLCCTSFSDLKYDFIIIQQPVQN